MKRLGLKLGGMTGTACANAVEQAITHIPGVVDSNVNFALKRATIEYNGRQTNPIEIVQAIVDAGYQATLLYPPATQTSHSQRKLHAQDLDLKLSVGIVVSLLLMIGYIPQVLGREIGWIPESLHHPIGQLILATLVQFWCGQSLAIEAWQNVRYGSTNLSLLIWLGTTSTYLYSLLGTFAPQFLTNIDRLPPDVYYGVSTVAITIGLWTNQLTNYTRFQSIQAIRHATKKSIKTQPQTVRIIESGQEQIVPIDEIKVGQIISVRPGEIIPLDGTIVAGVSVIDEMMITGVNQPITREIGDRAIGSTFNQTGMLNIRVSQVLNDTVVVKTGQLVDRIQAASVKTNYLVNRVAKYFLPVIILLSIATGLVWFKTTANLSLSLITGVGVLIAGYPYALCFAVSTAITSGTKQCAKHRILIKNSLSLELLQQVNTIVFDQTGTVTVGTPTVTDFIPVVDNYHGDELAILQLVASVETLSLHPLATAIIDYAAVRQVKLLPVEQFQEIIGSGIQAIVSIKNQHQPGHKLVQIGSDEWIATLGIETVIQVANHNILNNYQQEWQTEGKKVAWVAIDGEIAGIMAIGDAIKPTAVATVNRLKKLGVDVVLLTGDNWENANRVARQVGIERVFADINPQAKAEIIHSFQSNNRSNRSAIVAMVGDGINDAPALAQADVGISMSTGAEMAITASDLTIISPDLRTIMTAIEISRTTAKQLSQNLWLASIYHLIAIPIAAGVFYPQSGLLLNPPLVCGVIALSCLSVAINNLRLRKFRRGLAGK